MIEGNQVAASTSGVLTTHTYRIFPATCEMAKNMSKNELTSKKTVNSADAKIQVICHNISSKSGVTPFSTLKYLLKLPLSSPQTCKP
jgi:hypothetical protein